MGDGVDNAQAAAELSALRMCTLSVAAVGLAALLADPDDSDVIQMREAARQMVIGLGPDKVHAFIQKSLLQAAQSIG